MKPETIKYFHDAIIYQRQILNDLHAHKNRAAYKERKAYYDGMLDIIQTVAHYEMPVGENTVAGLLEKYGYSI